EGVSRNDRVAALKTGGAGSGNAAHASFTLSVGSAIRSSLWATTSHSAGMPFAIGHSFSPASLRTGRSPLGSGRLDPREHSAALQATRRQLLPHMPGPAAPHASKRQRPTVHGAAPGTSIT